MIKKLKFWYNRWFVDKTNPHMKFGTINLNDSTYHDGYVDGNNEMRIKAKGVAFNLKDYETTTFIESRLLALNYNLIYSGLFCKIQVHPQHEKHTVGIYKIENSLNGQKKYYFIHNEKQYWLNADVYESCAEISVL